MAKKRNNRHLFFRIGSELYATKLSLIREVVEEVPYKPVPNSSPHCLGVFSLRGEILSLIDMHRMLNLKEETRRKRVYLVFETKQGVIAALVDQIDSVTEIPDSAIRTKKDSISLRIPDNYVEGFAWMNEQLVIMVNLAELIGDDPLIDKRFIAA